VAARKQLFGECYTHTIVDLEQPERSLMWRWTIRQEGDHLWKLVEPVTAGRGGKFPAWEGRNVAPEDQARYERGELELFDVAADPGETRNLAAAQAGVVAGLQASLDAWWKPATPASVAASGGPQQPAASARPRPNLLVFLADDLGARDLGCTGSSFYCTPAIDALAAAGMMFTRGYAACPVCSPTRAALITGRHPARVRITNYIAGDRRGKLLGADYLKALPEAEVTVPELLKQAGYTTGIFGKWHLGPPEDIPAHGFDVTGSTNVRPGGGPLDDPLHARAIAGQAATFITEAAASGRPWFCYVPMHSVHVPLITRPELAAAEGKRATGVGPRFDLPAAPPGDPFTRSVQDHPVYAGMICEMDETVAAVLGTLAALAALVLVPAELRLEGKGTLEPVHRREVFAQIDGVVEKIEPGVEGGGDVKAGQLLATLRNRDLEVAIADVLGKKASSEEQLVSTRRSLLEDDKISADEKLRMAGRRAQLEREVESLAAQLALYAEKKKELEVRSPIDGVIVTWQVRDLLLLRPVEKGQVLMSVADKTGPWELEIKMPDDRLGHVNRAAAEAKAAGKELIVDYILATDPGTRHRGSVKEIHEQAEVRGDEGNTVLVRVTIDPSRHEKEELGAGASVTARVACGKRSLGYVWFHDVLSFIQTQVLFRLW
jgi:multidrug efflux pump subunit AcrA (membrane-fusion protein)